MKAVQLQSFGSFDNIKVVDIPKPEPTPGKLLVHITHAAVNPGDASTVMGHIPFAKQPPLILGLEGAGIVMDNGGDTRFPVNSRVIVYGGTMGMAQDGTWCEYVSIDPAYARLIPTGMSSAEAAGLSLVYLTAQSAFYQANLAPGASVLVTTMGGGVGNAAYQLALLQGAGLMIGTVGSLEKKKAAQAFIDTLLSRPTVQQTIQQNLKPGAKMLDFHTRLRNNVIDLSSENLEERVRQITDGQGVDYIVDTLGGDYTPRLIELAKPGGKIAIVGYKAGLQTSLNIMTILANQLTLLGSNVFTVSSDTADRAMNTIFDLIVKQMLRPVISARYPLTNAVEALNKQMEPGNFGKIILEIY